MARSARIGMSAVALGSLILLSGACSKSADVATVAPSNTGVTALSSNASPSTTENLGGPSTTVAGDVTTTTVSKTKPSTVQKAPTTTTPTKLTGADFAAQAVAAYKDQLGEFKALEMVIHVDNSNATLQAQDPTKPANVDEYDFSKGKIEDPVPVKITGDGDLESNLFAAGEIAWDKLPDMMEQAKTSIGDLEGSKGVTHLIIKKNLPFDSDTVVDVYVDGGTRTSGGYVMFKADGTLKKVYGPS